MDTNTHEAVAKVFAQLIHTNQTARTPTATSTRVLFYSDVTGNQFRECVDNKRGGYVSVGICLTIYLRDVDCSSLCATNCITLNEDIYIASGIKDNRSGGNSMLLCACHAIAGDGIVDIADGSSTCVHHRNSYCGSTANFYIYWTEI